MANVYSALLFENGDISKPGGDYNSIVVPSGYLWVVRDMYFTVPTEVGYTWSHASGFEVTDHAGARLWNVTSPRAEMNVGYHWTGHQVVNTGDQLTVAIYDTGWTWRISGYQLTTP